MVGLTSSFHSPRPAAAATTPFDAADVRRLEGVAQFADRLAAADLAGLYPAAASALAGAFPADACVFAHCAVLLFPETLDGALRHFAARGLHPQPPIPSVLVRRRLCERYGLDTAACDVSVTRVRTSPMSTTGHRLEVFLFPKNAAALDARIVEQERALGFENHVAFDIAQPDEQRLEGLIALLQQEAGLVWEGGGHNPYEGAGGSTMFYFVGRRFDRLELHCQGDFSAVVDRHPVRTEDVAKAYAAWTRHAA